VLYIDLTNNITSKGQITIPKKVRDELGLLPGTQVEFEKKGNSFVLRKKSNPQHWLKWAGKVNIENDEVDDFMDQLRGK
jgi:antitoxin PrlF